MYRTYVYQCWGSRSRSRYKGTAHSCALGPGVGVLRTHVLWATNAQKLSIVCLHWGIILFLIPVCMQQVPGTRYIFCHRGSLHCQESVYVACTTRYCIGGLHVPYVDHC